jgi:adenine-specific DNA-methyltransferase
MATGISKTKWQGDIDLPPADISAEITLAYAGKKTPAEIFAMPSAATQLLWSGTDVNQLYYGDNLAILALLRQTPALLGQVRLIYIDPPFATKSVFQSRNQTDAYHDLRAGAAYIEFLRERLILLKELLADDGSIYLHLDTNMAFHLKLIMDEVFGAANFRNWITRKKCNPKNYTRKNYGNVSDFILFYTKSDNYVWHRPYEAWTEQRAEKEYQYVEAETGRHYKKVPIHAPGTRNGETGKEWRGMLPPPGKHWQYTPARLEEMDARGEIYWSPTGNPRRKVYFDESAGIAIQDIWLEFRDAHNQNINITGYPTEKNPDMLRRIIETSSNEGDWVLDCFAGSGTTLDVAGQLKRRWVGIDNSSEAIATILQRLTTGLSPMGDFINRPETVSQGQQLAMFAPTPSPAKNFSVYAAEPYQGQIDSAIQQWLKEQPHA